MVNQLKKLMKEYRNIITAKQGTYGVICHNLRKKSSKKFQMNFNKGSSLLDDPELRSIQQISNKKFRDRNFQETADLNNFLLKTKIEAEFKIDVLSSKVTTETILYYATQFIEIKFYNANDFIYLSGDKSDNIFLLLKGEVNLNKIETENVNMTMEEYYNYLKEEMQNSPDSMLIMNIIDTNSHIFPLRRQTDLSEIDNIIFLIKLTLATNELSVPTVDKIKLLYQEYKKDHQQYHFDLVVKGNKDMKRFHADVAEKISERERYYSYLMQRSNYSAVPIMKMYYLCTRTVKPFSYFGNFKIWNMDSNIRTESAKCSADVFVLCINKKLYGACLLNEQRQIKEKEMEKVHQSYFFRNISKQHFNKDIYYGFDLKEYFRGQIIYDSNEVLNSFYIIKEGLINVTLETTSLLELDNTLETLMKCDKRLYSIDETYVINHPYSLIQAHLNKKRTYKVFGSSKKQMFGDWELYYNKKKSPFTATVTSEKAIVYSYKYIDFENEKDDRVLLLEGLKEQAYNKLLFVLERLKTIRYSFYKKIDTEIQRKLKEEQLITPQSYSEAFSLKPTAIKINPNKMNKRIRIAPEKEIENRNINYPKRDRNNEATPLIKENSKDDQTFDNKDLSILTCFHSYKKSRGYQPKYFLPPIHLDLSEDKKRIIKHLKNTNQHIVTTELSNTYFKKENNMRVMLPMPIARNVPLINKLKYCITHNNSKFALSHENIDSLSKSILKKNYSNEHKVKQSLKNMPGAYFVAVQQLITK